MLNFCFVLTSAPHASTRQLSAGVSVRDDVPAPGAEPGCWGFIQLWCAGGGGGSCPGDSWDMGIGDYMCVTLRGGAPWGFTLTEGQGDTYRPLLVSQVRLSPSWVEKLRKS